MRATAAGGHPSFMRRVKAAWRVLTGRSADFAALEGESVSGFAGGAVGRLQASLANWSGSINADLDGQLPILRARSRQLASSNEHGKRFVSMCAINIVGRQNPKLQVRALRDARDPNKPTTLDKAANDTIEWHWERAGKTMDVTGRHKSIYALLRTIVKAVARDGESLVRIVRDRAMPYGIAVQVLEADRLEHTLNGRMANGNQLRQGVEINSFGRPVAYHVRSTHPGETYANGPSVIERIPADDLIHLYLPERAEQVRGVPWMHAAILRASTIHKFEEAAVTAAQIGASKVAAIERSEDSADATSQILDGRSAQGLGQIKVEAGEMFELPPGYKLNSWNPDYPHANFDGFLKSCLRGLAVAWDVAAHNLTGDMTDVNYSSARIAELSERESWMILQDWLITSLVMPLYEEWLAIALLMGKITFPLSGSVLPADRLQKFLAASTFCGRRWQWVDPEKEASAYQKLLEARLTSRTRITAEQGIEFDDLVSELAEEQRQLREAGIDSAPAPQAPQPAGAVPAAAAP